MADKMMRIAGRGEDGLAKALKTDDDGKIEISSPFQNEEIIVDNASVDAGIGRTVITSMTIENLAGYRMVVRSNIETTFSLIVYPVSFGYRLNGERDVVFSEVETNINKPVISDKQRMKTDSFALAITNHGSEPAEFTVLLIRTDEDKLSKVENVLVPKPVKIASGLKIQPESKHHIRNLVVEDALAFNLLITSVSGAPYVSVGVGTYTESYYVSSVAYGYEPLLTKTPLNDRVAMTGKYLIKNPNIGIDITNHDSVERTFNVYMYKSITAEGSQDYMNRKEIYGPDLDSRPNRFSVRVGTVYMQTDTQEIWLNRGESGWLKL